MNYTEIFDHHSENYTGIEGAYRGMDANDYAFDAAVDKLNNNNNDE